MSWNTEWDKEFIEWDITSKLFLNMFDIRIYIYICTMDLHVLFDR